MMATASTHQQFHFTCVAWGTDYVWMLTHLVIPNLLGSGNLPDFPYLAASCFKIYTTAEYRAEIEKSSAYKKLCDVISTEIIDLHRLTSQFAELPTFTDGAKYNLMNIAHQDAVKSAESCKAYIVFFFPDHIYPENTFLRLARYAEEGRKVVMIGGLRTNREDVIPELLTFRKNGTLNIRSQELVNLIMSHPHEIVKTLFWDAPFSSTWPSHIYFQVGDEGILVRGFHLHPLMVLAQRPGKMELTLDSDYYHSVCDSVSEIYIVGSSEELACLELTSKNLSDRSRVDKPATYQAIAHFLKTQQLEPVMQCASHPIMLLRTPSPSALWESAITRSKVIVNRASALVSAPD